MDALTNLYDKLSIGGYCIIGDYGENSWTYRRKAVMIRVDSKCFFWQRDR